MTSIEKPNVGSQSKNRNCVTRGMTDWLLVDTDRFYNRPYVGNGTSYNQMKSGANTRKIHGHDGRWVRYILRQAG
jgi:hypothetical protein